MNQLSGPVLQWIREGYPEGVPDDESAALLAVLQERIGGDRALDVLRRLHKDGVISDSAASALLPEELADAPGGRQARARWLAAGR